MVLTGLPTETVTRLSIGSRDLNHKMFRRATSVSVLQVLVSEHVLCRCTVAG